MVATTKITKVGNSSAIILPKELMERLKLRQGDEVSIGDVPNGILISPYNEQKERQLDRAREIMRENRNMLKKLAE